MGYRSASQPEGLADVLERILDKGIVIAGDVSVSLVGIELLTIRLRLLIATVDKAREMGIDWWSHDPYLNGRPRPGTPGTETETETAALRDRLAQLEAQLAALGAQGGAAPALAEPASQALAAAGSSAPCAAPEASSADVVQPVFRRYKEAP
ncbi:gas vesicle protein [Rhodobacter capsulatus]|uniref:gas vesicle protein n=1 Tax=Rhodobacter capsulatus TaxID=1061 RepID=UPI0003D2A7B0|nr:gas vesicle protein [Rhodobacter capsulatus]ETD81632.1 gas vesicle protein GvpA [Rhodobacter capsulatus YW1]